MFHSSQASLVYDNFFWPFVSLLWFFHVTNLQQRLFGVGLQSLYRALQLSKFNQLFHLLLSFLLRKLIRMRSSLDVLAKLLTSMKNGKVNGNALMPEISLHSIFLQQGENPRFSLLPATVELWLIHWSEQLKCQTASYNPIVLVISTVFQLRYPFQPVPLRDRDCFFHPK